MTSIIFTPEPGSLVDRACSGTALVVFNVADSSLTEVAAGVAARRMREASH